MVPTDMEFLKERGEVGDCVRAATASILGVPIAEVPHFVKDHDHNWRAEWEDWLEARGWNVVEIDPRQGPDCYHLAAGPTIRSKDETALHMVVMKGPWLAHDPHPSHAGLLAANRKFILAAMDAATMRGGQIGHNDS